MTFEILSGEKSVTGIFYFRACDGGVVSLAVLGGR